MDNIIPISDLQTKAKKYVDQVRLTETPIVVTQRGRAAAVLISYEEYQGLEATRDEMSYPDWKARLERAERERREGKGIALKTFARKKATSR
jgi:prevent-host-death family protein